MSIESQESPPIPAELPQNKVGRDLALLLFVVLCGHLAVVFASRHGLIRDDAESYVLIGRNLAKGYGYVFQEGRPPTAWRAPGYPILLASVFRISDGALWAARIVNAFLLTFAAFLGYRLSANMLPGLLPRMQPPERHAVALIAGGLIGCYPEFVGLTGLIWSENLFVPLFLGAVSALYALGKQQTVPLGLLAGVLTGFCILTRSTSVILLPMVWFCALRNGFNGRALCSGLLASAVALLILGCWTARNYAIMGRFVLVESNVGYNLYVGNRPDTPIPFAWTRAKSLTNDALYQRLNTGRTEADASAALTKAAVQQIERDPLRTAFLGVGKIFDFWLPDFFIAFNMRSGALGPENAGLWKPVLVFTALFYLLVMFCAVAGTLRTRKTWETCFLLFIVALYTLPHAVVYGLSRYHLPLMPLLILLAAPVIRRVWLALFCNPAILTVSCR